MLGKVNNQRKEEKEKKKKSWFVVFAKFCGANTPTVAQFNWPTWRQLAHKISENWAIGSHKPVQASPV